MQNRKNSELFEYITQSGMTKAQIISRLNEMIDAESLKPEEQRDAEFISVCLELQYFVTTGEEYQSSKEVAKKKLMQAIHVQKEDRNKAKPRKLSIGVAAACVACLFLVLPIVGQTLLERRWIEGTTVEGGEVYRLNGNQIDPELLRSVLADKEQTDISIQTTDFNAISHMPEVRSAHAYYIPENWKLQGYSYTRTEDSVFYTEQYSHDEYDQSIVISATFHADVEMVNSNIEQDQEGTTVQYGDKMVYIATNHNMQVASWSKELESYLVSGPITLEEVKKIIRSMGDTYEQEEMDNP